MDNIFILAMTAVALLIGFLLGASAALESDLSAWLHNWQTLIAGTAAVAAAYLTVLQMRRSDDLAQQRFERVAKANRASDLRKIEVAWAASSELKIFLDYATELKSMPEYSDRANFSRKLQAKIRTIGNRLQNFVEQPAIAEARPFFDIRLERRLQHIKDTATLLNDGCELLLERANRNEFTVAGDLQQSLLKQITKTEGAAKHFLSLIDALYRENGA